MLAHVTHEEITAVHKAWIKSDKQMALAPIAEYMDAPLEFHKIRLALAYIVKNLNT